MSYSVRSRNRSSGTRTCATCAHDGQCDGLPNCGGTCWQDAFSECAQCGERFRDEGDYRSEDGHYFCSEKCLEDWERDHESDEGEETGDGE